MNLVLQVILVALVVAGCATYSIWRLLSGAARQRTLNLLAKLPAVAAMGWFVRLQARTQAPGGGCGSCSAAASAPSRKQTPGALHR
jgi:hypothetical protein